MLEIITYSSFILMGFISLLPKKEKISSDTSSKQGIIEKIFVRKRLPFKKPSLNISDYKLLSPSDKSL